MPTTTTAPGMAYPNETNCVRLFNHRLADKRLLASNANDKPTAKTAVMPPRRRLLRHQSANRCQATCCSLPNHKSIKMTVGRTNPNRTGRVPSIIKPRPGKPLRRCGCVALVDALGRLLAKRMRCCARCSTTRRTKTNTNSNDASCDAALASSRTNQAL